MNYIEPYLFYSSLVLGTMLASCFIAEHLEPQENIIIDFQDNES